MPDATEGEVGQAPHRSTDMDPWQKEEHETVFHSLKDALSHVGFPASKSEIARRVGGVTLSLPREKRENEALSEDQAERQVSDVPLVKYVDALPDRRYESMGDVTSTLDAKWQDLASYRDANWEAAANRRNEE